MEKTDIKSLDYDELKDFFVSIGEKPFRAKQVYQWMHEKQADGFEEMTNLSCFSEMLKDGLYREDLYSDL